MTEEDGVRVERVFEAEGMHAHEPMVDYIGASERQKLTFKFGAANREAAFLLSRPRTTATASAETPVEREA